MMGRGVLAVAVRRKGGFTLLETVWGVFLMLLGLAFLARLNWTLSRAQTRAEETALLQYTTHALNRLFKPANPLLGALRNAGLNLTNRLPVVRNTLVRYAVSGHF